VRLCLPPPLSSRWQLLRQFKLQLQRDRGEEFGVGCQEGLIDIRSIEDDHVVTRAEWRRIATGRGELTQRV
jgi:hypothetical protein